MEKQEAVKIAGNIEYEILLEDGQMQVTYNENTQNNLAANSIMSLLTQSAKENLKSHYKQNPRDKKLGIVLNQSAQGLLWLKTNWESLYTVLQREQEVATLKEKTATYNEVGANTTVTQQQMPTEE